MLSWKIGDENFVSHAPLLDKGRLFFADWGGQVYGVDASSGFVHWTAQAESPRRERPWHGFCGTGAVAEGRLFEASAEGFAFAFSTVNGNLLWKKRFTFSPQAGNRGKLIYHDGVIYIPVSPIARPGQGSEEGHFQGSVVALRAEDGARLWEQPIESIPTSQQTGVDIGHGFALDAQAGLLFLTTNTNYNGQPSGFSSSIVALDTKTGELHWSWQIPYAGIGDERDPSVRLPGFVAGPQLFQVFHNGEWRQVVGAGDTRGRYWAVDRESVIAGPLWIATLFEPFAGGQIIAEASIGTNQLLFWGNHPATTDDRFAGAMNVNAANLTNGGTMWVNWQTAGLVSAAGFLSGDVYFVGTRAGRVRAFSASDGRPLWTSPPTKPVSAPLVVAGDTLYFSGGVPEHLGGTGSGGGVYAFAPNPKTPPPYARR